MAVENANKSNAIATSFPPYSPSTPWEKALAVNWAELTNDLPSKNTDSTTLPFFTFNEPEYRLEFGSSYFAKEDETITSSAIDLEWITVILSVINLPFSIANKPENSLTFESIFWTYFVNSLIWSGYK